MQIAIANHMSSKVEIWAQVEEITEDGAIHFCVINGHWHGIFFDNEVEVKNSPSKNDDCTRIPAAIIWAGHVPNSLEYYSGSGGWHNDYDHKMKWIQNQVDDPNYCMPPIDQIIATKIQQHQHIDNQIDDDDDIPF